MALIVLTITLINYHNYSKLTIFRKKWSYCFCSTLYALRHFTTTGWNELLLLIQYMHRNSVSFTPNIGKEFKIIDTTK